MYKEIRDMFGGVSTTNIRRVTDGASTKLAVMLEWKRITLALAASAPSATNVFEGMGM